YRVRDDSTWHASTSRPEIFGTLFAHIVERHRASYEQYLPQVISGLGTEVRRLESWIGELGQANDWLEAQRSAWGKTARQQERALTELHTRVRQLEQAKDWLEAQRSVWEKTARQQERALTELHTRVRQLEQAKDWLEAQRTAWERTAKQQEQVIAEQREWVA